MKHIGEEIHRLAEQKNMVKKDLAAKLGMSSSQFANMRSQRSIGADLLDRVSKELGVHPGYFFDDEPSGRYSFGDINNSNGIVDATVNFGKIESQQDATMALLAEKERMIRVLMKQLGITEVTGL